MARLLISDIAERAGVTPATIRYYETTWGKGAMDKLKPGRRIHRLAAVLLIATLGVPAVARAQLIIANIPVGGIRVAVNPTTDRVYVTSGNHLSVIDGVTNVVEAVVDIGGVGAPWGLAVNEATNRIYVANFVDVKVVDGATNTIVAAFQGGSNENSIAVNPLTNRIYVGTNNALFPRVNVFDGVTNALVASVAVDGMPLHMAVNVTTNRIYVTKQYACVSSIGSFCLQFQASTTVSVIDGVTNSEVATIPLNSNLQGVGVNPATNRIYVANPASATVAIVNGDTDEVVAAIPLAGSRAVAVNATTNHVYVGTGELISAIDGATNTLVVSSVGSGFHGAANPVTSRIYMAKTNENAVAVIEDAPVLLPDTVAPDWPAPSALTALDIGLRHVSLGWTAAHDAYGVLRYQVYQDSALVREVSGRVQTTRVSGLVQCTVYNFNVEASDPNGNASTDGPSLTVQTLTPAEATLKLADQVSLLVAQGRLDPGHGMQLRQTLEAAARQLDAGRIVSGVGLLEAFIQQVQILMQTGDLDEFSGNRLIAGANEIIASPVC